ncbi:MAG TPA: protocatechuate 3,4-dioxygenase subunit beta, partial [Candidatus Dormibacteraeota bacterium]|nr:protocatechuate 3,4-dioxygenase subunit beta [Candidatus Dormibacteraeota bacterium]
MNEDEREPPYLYPDYVGTRLRAPAKPLVNLPEGFHDFPAPLFP